MQQPDKPQPDPKASDEALLVAAREGSRTALELLLARHRPFIYNVAWRLVLSPADAEDLTQEVLIKALTRLDQFQGRSSFRTWLYRIAMNHFLEMKRRPMEQAIGSFEAFGAELDAVPNEDLSTEEQLSQQELIQEAKLGCLAGMLLCLDRRQRLVYVLGEIFELSTREGAELTELSEDNYRQILSRARRDLRAFMNQKCGLVNPDNPCRCQRKTKGFIQAGWVDPGQMKFNLPHQQSILQSLEARQKQLEEAMEGPYRGLFQAGAYDQRAREQLLASLLAHPHIQLVFNLN
ncbi:MAG: RNA polymerase sigma factor [Bacteroidetes bacterium]|jgi:RNA polymerase sigma factor (sigma-70 family)|nr:RNA polymerase sigma factor [Bacteroidota bacterium]